MTGKLGSLGQPVLRSKAKEMEKQFAARLRAAFEPAEPEASAMTPFELAEPSSLAEAIGLLDAEDPTVRPISGGTALMLMMKAGVFQPTRLVSLRGIEEHYTNIAAGEDGALDHRRHDAAGGVGAIGSGAPACAGDHPHAADSVKYSRAQCRDRWRHLAHADPHMDLPPVLIALARACRRYRAVRRTKRFRSSNCLSGYYETVLARNELIAELVVPSQAGREAVLSEMHDPRGARLAGAWRGGLDRGRCATRSRMPAS